MFSSLSLSRSAVLAGRNVKVGRIYNTVQPSRFASATPGNAKAVLKADMEKDSELRKTDPAAFLKKYSDRFAKAHPDESFERNNDIITEQMKRDITNSDISFAEYTHKYERPADEATVKTRLEQMRKLPFHEMLREYQLTKYQDPIEHPAPQWPFLPLDVLGLSEMEQASYQAWYVDNIKSKNDFRAFIWWIRRDAQLLVTAPDQMLLPRVIVQTHWYIHRRNTGIPGVDASPEFSGVFGWFRKLLYQDEIRDKLALENRSHVTGIPEALLADNDSMFRHLGIEDILDRIGIPGDEREKFAMEHNISPGYWTLDLALPSPPTYHSFEEPFLIKVAEGNEDTYSALDEAPFIVPTNLNPTPLKAE